MNADESDLHGVGRPARHRVAVHGGSEVAQRFAAEIVYGDEAVIAAMGDEGDFGAVGRPLRRIIFAAHEGELMRGHSAGNRRDPELAARGPDGHRAIG